MLRSIACFTLGGTLAACAHAGTGAGPAACGDGPLPALGTPRDVAAADFDGDQVMDLAVVADGGVGVLRGVGNRRFCAGATGYPGQPELDRISALSLADEASPPWLVLWSPRDPGLVVLPTRADGTFGAPRLHRIWSGESGTRKVLAGDTDGNGSVELVALPTAEKTPPLAIDPTRPGDPGRALPVPEATTVYDVADLDGDRVLDLVHAAGTPQVRVVYRFGTSHPRPACPAFLCQPGWTGSAWSFAPARLHATDYDGDRVMDIVAVSPGASLVVPIRGEGEGRFRTQLPVRTRHGWVLDSDVAMGDLDDDGRLDLVAAESRTGHLTIRTGHPGDHHPRRFAMAGPTTAHRVDLDRDGLDDFVVTSAGDGTATVLYGERQGNLGPLVTVPVTARR